MRWLVLLLALLVLPLAHAADPVVPPPAPSLASARELYCARRDAEARSAFELLLAADPANHEAVYHLGRLALRRDDWKTASTHYQHCTKLDPTNALYWADLGEAYGKLAGQAGLFQQLGLARKCHLALEKAVELAPDNLDYRHGLIEFYEQAPSIAGGGRDKALAQAAELTRRDPFNGTLVTGGIQAHARNWSEAEVAFLAAIKLRPNALEPIASLGLLYADQGRYPDAFAQFDRLLTLDPDHLAGLYQLGRVAALSGQRLADGSAALRRYLGKGNLPAELPRPHHAHYRLGQIMVHQGDAAAAKAAFEASIQLDPKFKEAAAELKKLQL
ncbi:MAG: tetratricopeptide repeat protein [Opitutaceae bacterium]|nr:tetratricopeptide repeat protein [Opitutaceae bacterium]